MTGLLHVIDMLGVTILQLQEQVRQLQEQLEAERRPREQALIEEAT